MSIRSISLDNTMQKALQDIKRDILPNCMKRAIVHLEYVDPSRVDAASKRALLTGIDSFCGAYDLVDKITKATTEYKNALFSDVKETKIFLNTIASCTAVVGSIFSLLPVPPHGQFSEELRQKYSVQWGIASASATLAVVACLKIFTSTCLIDEEERNRSLLNHLWTQLDGRIPKDLLEASDNLQHQFTNHLLTYVYLCKRFNLKIPENLQNIVSPYFDQ